MNDDAPPTLAERYASATKTSDLRIQLKKRGDGDIIIAAGWAAQIHQRDDRKNANAPLAVALWRVRTEFDSIKREHERVEPEHNRALAATLDWWRQELKAGPPERCLIEEFECRREEARTDARTARLLVLMQIKSLYRAKIELGAFALRLAAYRRAPLDEEDVLLLAGQVLDVFLDPKCPDCRGRGYNGASHRGEPQIICRKCRGVGERRYSIGKDEARRVFAGQLLMAMEREAAGVGSRMSGMLAA